MYMNVTYTYNLIMLFSSKENRVYVPSWLLCIAKTNLGSILTKNIKIINIQYTMYVQTF